ncbi:MAG: hypothetical protein ACTSRF_11600 [Candidatus Freyarchaeota archaeon]
MQTPPDAQDYCAPVPRRPHCNARQLRGEGRIAEVDAGRRD